MTKYLPMTGSFQHRRIVNVIRNGGQSCQRHQKHERSPNPDIEDHRCRQAPRRAGQPINVNSHGAEKRADQTTLIGKERDAEISDRYLRGEQWSGKDRPEESFTWQPDRNNPGENKSYTNLNRNRNSDEEHGDEDGVPESAVGQDAGVVSKSNVTRNPFTEHVVGKAKVNRRCYREECQPDNPDHRWSEQGVLESSFRLALN